jgi:serine/threonine-protein kinase
MTDVGHSPQRTCPLCGSTLASAATFCSHCGSTIARGGDDSPLLGELRALLEPELRVEREIGRGGTAAVFLGYDPALDRRVAIKTLLPELASSDMVERFQREARLVASLQHQNVVTIYGVRGNGDTSAIVMQFVEGRSLDDALRDGALPLDVAGLVLAQAAVGLQHAHDRGIVHRDVKPANVLLASDGLAVVSDFGIARREGLNRLTASGVLLGTMAYMSPEQIVGEAIGAASDRYSFGVMAFELLSGRLPFTGSGAQILNAHLNLAPPPLESLRPDLPAPVCAYVARLLEKDPARRPTDLREARRVFMSLVKDERAATTGIMAISQVRAGVHSRVQRAVTIAPHPAPASPAPAPVDARRRLGWMPLASAAAAVIIVAVVFVRWSSTRTSAPPSTASAAASTEPVRAADTLRRDSARVAVTTTKDDRPSSSPPTRTPASDATPVRQAGTAATADTSAVGNRSAPADSGASRMAAAPAAENPTQPPTASSSPPVSSTVAAGATTADARTLSRQFITFCNQHRWQELERLGTLGGDATLRTELVRLVRSAPEFSAGFDRVASSPSNSGEQFSTEFVADLEWRGGHRLMVVQVQATRDNGTWRLTAFAVTPPE